MTLLYQNNFMTVAKGEGLRGQLLATHVGMAHFAGSGPLGEQCKDCAFYGPPSRRTTPTQDESRRRYRQMTGKRGAIFSKEAYACRHFERRPRPGGPAQAAPLPVQEKMF